MLMYSCCSIYLCDVWNLQRVWNLFMSLKNCFEKKGKIEFLFSPLSSPFGLQGQSHLPPSFSLSQGGPLVISSFSNCLPPLHNTQAATTDAAILPPRLGLSFGCARVEPFPSALIRFLPSSLSLACTRENECRSRRIHQARRTSAQLLLRRLCLPWWALHLVRSLSPFDSRAIWGSLMLWPRAPRSRPWRRRGPAQRPLPRPRFTPYRIASLSSFSQFLRIGKRCTVAAGRANPAERAPPSPLPPPAGRHLLFPPDLILSVRFQSDG